MATISLCMIVKNEEKVLERCLSSIADLMDEGYIRLKPEVQFGENEKVSSYFINLENDENKRKNNKKNNENE